MFDRKKIISGIFIFLISLGLFINSFTIKLTNIDKIVGSRLFPQIILILLMVFSLWLVASDIIAARKGNETVPKEAKGNQRTSKVLLVFLALAVYILFLEWTGFLVATIGYLFSQMYLLETKKQKNFLLYGVISVAAAAIIYIVFTKGFQMVLPRGKIF